MDGPVNAMHKPVGLSPAGAVRRKERIGAFADLWAGTLLTGARSAATAWALWTATKQVDLFSWCCTAANVPTPGASPFNNWLNAQQRPLFDVFPEEVGLYIGEHTDSQNAADDQQVKALILEHSMLELKTQNGGRVLLQPAITLPPGIGVQTFSTDSLKYTEQFGPAVPVGMFRVPEDTAFSSNDTINAILTIDALAQAALVGMAGNFPAQGTFIGVRIRGRALYNRPTGRA